MPTCNLQDQKSALRRNPPGSIRQTILRMTVAIGLEAIISLHGFCEEFNGTHEAIVRFGTTEAQEALACCAEAFAA